MWIPITLLAATFQILRTARQHELRDALNVNQAGFVRYAYGFPLASIVAVITFGIAGQDLPGVPWRFWLIVLGAGIAQIGATVALLRSFQLRDFAIGTVYVKSEVIIVAVISAIALGEPLTPLGWASALVCMVGVAWLAAPQKIGDALRSAGDPAAVMGILAALGFAIAAAGLRAGSMSLEGGTTWDRALFTLTAMLGLQVLVNGTQLLTGSASATADVARAWRAALPVGVLSLAGSICWAVAVTLASAAKVRTLGQVELVLAFAISALWLHEHHRRAEYAASALVMIGVIGVVVLG